MNPTTMISYEDLRKLNQPFEKEYENAFKEFLESGWYILGKQVKNFEEAFGRYHNSNFVVGVANGLDALFLSLENENFPKGSEIIVPANTYIATILSIVQCGHVPVLVEPNINTYNIDADKIEEAITPKTKAIMVVHLYGQCCQMDAINRIAAKHNLVVVEDCAQAHGAKFKGQLAGTFGSYGAFSFYPTKNLGALGDGGAIVCHTEQRYNRLKQLRNYGSGKKYYNEIVGYNSRLDELQAAFLSVKLLHLDAINNHKRKLARLYLDHLDKSKFILPVEHADYHNVYHIFNIRHNRRDELKKYLFDNGIGTEIHYPLAPHHQNALKDLFINKNFPLSEAIHNTTLSLPCSFIHTEADVYKVIEVMNRF